MGEGLIVTVMGAGEPTVKLAVAVDGDTSYVWVGGGGGGGGRGDAVGSLPPPQPGMVNSTTAPMIVSRE
jgi:hypothetical protein